MSKYLNTDYLRSLSKIDAELEKFLKANPVPKPTEWDIKDFKASIHKNQEIAKQRFGDPPPGIKQTELRYTTRDGAKIRAKLHRPDPPPKEGSPIIMMLHGGGYCIGEPESEEPACRAFVKRFGATCIAPTYRLAPEFTFPHAIEDAWDALKWIDERAESWGADPTRGFLLGGSSAGAQLAGALSILARDRGLKHQITGQYLAVPPTTTKEHLPEQHRPYYLSREDNKNPPVLPINPVGMFIGAYDPDGTDPRFNLMVDPKKHKHLPPTFIQIDGLDPLRDDGLIYERLLREAGVKTRMDVYPGLPHGHWGFFPFLKASEQFRKDQIDGISWLLQHQAKTKVKQGRESPSTSKSKRSPMPKSDESTSSPPKPTGRRKSKRISLKKEPD